MLLTASKPCMLELAYVTFNRSWFRSYITPHHLWASELSPAARIKHCSSQEYFCSPFTIQLAQCLFVFLVACKITRLESLGGNLQKPKTRVRCMIVLAAYPDDVSSVHYITLLWCRTRFDQLLSIYQRVSRKWKFMRVNWSTSLWSNRLLCPEASLAFSSASSLWKPKLSSIVCVNENNTSSPSP